MPWTVSSCACASECHEFGSSVVGRSENTTLCRRGAKILCRSGATSGGPRVANRRWTDRDRRPATSGRAAGSHVIAVAGAVSQGGHCRHAVFRDKTGRYSPFASAGGEHVKGRSGAGGGTCLADIGFPPPTARPTGERAGVFRRADSGPGKVEAGRVAAAGIRGGEAAMPKQIVTSATAPTTGFTDKSTPSPLAQAIRCGNLLFVSGQGPLDPDTREVVSPDIEEQTRQTLANLERILDAAGATMANVVNMRVCLRDTADFPRFNTAFTAFMKGGEGDPHMYRRHAPPGGRQCRDRLRRFLRLTLGFPGTRPRPVPPLRASGSRRATKAAASGPDSRAASFPRIRCGTGRGVAAPARRAR